MTRTNPAQARQQWQLGCNLLKQGDAGGALRRFEHATRLQPREPLYWLNLARTQMRQGQLAAAVDSARRALALRPGDEVACALAVQCLMQLKRFEETVALMQAWPPRAPRDLQFHLLHGQALEGLQRYPEAIEAYMRALAAQVDFAQAHARMGFCFNHLEMYEEAAQCFRTALALGVGEHDINVLLMLSMHERNVCRWGEAARDAQALRAALQALAPQVDAPVLPFTLLALFDDPALQLHAARIGARYCSRAVKPLPAPAPIAAQGRRLRVGYVSCDFFHHATTILMAGMLEAHDRTRFEVTLYSYSPQEDSPMRERVLRAAEHFVEIGDLSSEAAARRMREDGIDILVDLKGFTRNARLDLLAYRPSPVQVSFLGYPGTSGAPWLDYIVGDAVVTPLEQAAHYSECIAQLPGCYQPNDSSRPLPEPATRAQAGLPEDALVLCGFTQPYKLSPEVLDAWCAVVLALPGAVLWLLEWNDQVRKNLVPELARRGVGAERVVWARPLRYELHLARQQLADLFLDTWPYNGHTTVSDALWAGVPVVTVRGNAFAARVAASLNHAVGLDALTFDSVEALVAGAVALGRDAGERTRLRAHLAAQRGVAALFDSARFARDIEALYERMAVRSAAGLPPAPLPAAG